MKTVSVQNTLMNAQWKSLHQSPLSAIVGYWHEGRLLRISLQKEPQDEGIGGDALPLVDREIAEARTEYLDFFRLLQEGIERFFDNQPQPLPWRTFLLDDRTDFQRAVLKACYQIRPGQTLSYGQLAARAGSPLAARAVGQVMATNRYPLFIPCHRVVASQQKLGGFSAPGGLKTKEWLLHHEQSSAIESNGR